MPTVLDRLLGRKSADKPGATSVAEILTGWPAAPAGTCDLCGNAIGSTGTHRVPNREFKSFMKKGYNPYGSGHALANPSAPAASMYKLMGLTKAQAYAGWRDMVTRDSTDWGLCTGCAKDVAGYAISH